MTQHAPLPPSGAASWVACPKWPYMQRPDSDRDTTAADEGTAAHAALHTILTGGEANHPDAQEAADRIRSAAGGAMIMSETVLKMPRIHADCWGTCDVFWCDLEAETLHIVDFKYGHGYVSEYKNWQMLAYAEGAREYSKWRPKHVAMTIYQPRCYTAEPWRTWTISANEHDKYVEQLHLAAKMVSPNAHARTGPHCRYCSGRAGCEALQQSGLYIADSVAPTTGDDLPDRELGHELSILKRAEALLTARITGLEEVAKVRMRSGAQVPGWGLEQGFGREKWTVPDEDVVALGKALGIELGKVTTITPAQARKKGLDASVTDLYATKPAGEIKLVPVSEHKAAKVFQ